MYNVLLVLAVLQFAFNVLLTVVAALFWRRIRQEAHKRGLLDQVDLLRKRKQWYR